MPRADASTSASRCASGSRPRPSSSVPSMSMARRRIMAVERLNGQSEIEVNATTAIFHPAGSRTSVNWSTPCDTRLAVAHDLEVGAQVGEAIAVDRDHHVRERLTEGRRVRVLLQRGDPLVAGLKAVGPLAVALAGDDHERLRREIRGDLVELVVAEAGAGSARRRPARLSCQPAARTRVRHRHDKQTSRNQYAVFIGLPHLPHLP